MASDHRASNYRGPYNRVSFTYNNDINNDLNLNIWRRYYNPITNLHDVSFTHSVSENEIQMLKVMKKELATLETRSAEIERILRNADISPQQHISDADEAMAAIVAADDYLEDFSVSVISNDDILDVKTINQDLLSSEEWLSECQENALALLNDHQDVYEYLDRIQETSAEKINEVEERISSLGISLNSPFMIVFIVISTLCLVGVSITALIYVKISLAKSKSSKASKLDQEAGIFNHSSH